MRHCSGAVRSPPPAHHLGTARNLDALPHRPVASTTAVRAIMLAGGGSIAIPDMEDAMDSTQSEVSALFDRRSEAMRLKDIDRLMALYAPDIVYFDLVPPLRYAGAAALRDRFSNWFEGWEGPIGQEIGDLTISASGDVATAW